jgi:hypothetical protein
MKQFSIRDLLLLVAFVALALGWWIDRNNRVAPPARFQIQAVGDRAFILDTATGKVWGPTATEFYQSKIEK